MQGQRLTALSYLQPRGLAPQTYMDPRTFSPSNSPAVNRLLRPDTRQPMRSPSGGSKAAKYIDR